MLALLSTLLLTGFVAAQQPQYPPPFPPTPILPSSINYAPSVTPNVMDLTAPNAQNVCPGYTASDVQQSSSGVVADLTLAGPACNVYGTDIQNLVLNVQYQSKQRLNVKITPKYLVPANESLYILADHYTPLPGDDPKINADNSGLAFQWTNSPSFQFRIARKSTGDVLFSTYGSKIIFEDQFLEVKTSMVPNYNIYGLAAYIHSFRLGNNWTQTFWNAYNLQNDQEIDVNGHSTHPMYLETRYNGNGPSASHGVYARNAHGQDWLLRADSVTYRTIGGSIDLYFLSGPTPKEVISQYHTQIVGKPVMQPYWALGFHQVRWSYQNWTNLQDVLDAYAAQNIQVEGIMNDLDYLTMNRDFTNNPGHYDVGPGQEFLAKLHAAGQKYLPILDPNIYVSNPANASDAYPTYDRGAALNAYIRNGNDSFYIGVEWPGFSVWPDFTVPQGQEFWTSEIQNFYKTIEFDGFWLDVSDAVSFCTGSCGQGLIGENPIHVPFALPGDPDTAQAVNYVYPEGFAATNASEAASASAALASQSAAYPTPLVTPTPVLGRTQVTPGVRNLLYPPYAINNFLDGHTLGKQAIQVNATHNDGPYNSTEYELHNLYGHMSGNATYNALTTLYGGKRPFFIARSTFAGSGTFAGHWGGDTNSMFGNMYFGIAQALQFAIAGIPYFGVETCGFNDNADLQLCTRWMQLSAWFPLYRNHNNRNTIAQEAYRWATTAESTRRIMNIRYSLLPYTYTLFHQANTAGQTVLRALQWEFPDDPSLAAVETQFMSGPAILITPVLQPNVETVQGVFPGVAQGTQWYDWYTFEKVQVAPGENKTLSAPILTQPIHIRGGYIIPMQKAGNTTSTSRKSPWSLIVALDRNQQAAGDLYLDDGVSLVPSATKNVAFRFRNNILFAKVTGDYQDTNALANVTIPGLAAAPKSIAVYRNGGPVSGANPQFQYNNGTLFITKLDSATQGGAWSSDLIIRLVTDGQGQAWSVNGGWGSWGSWGSWRPE